MTTAVDMRVTPMKDFAKVLKKRFDLKLMRAQLILCRASGFHDLNEVYAQQYREQHFLTVESVHFDAWHDRLDEDLGGHLDALVSEEELQDWFRRIHGTTHEGTAHLPDNAWMNGFLTP
ncbi:hypothetical protein SNE35_09705 [Paucibacter sp. R3-3]|uniref:Uncharacterized protein n=1 Tax=Roseateles agri TaxID=3098619 RepID=A0ABU5DGA6_9BURK|nr:hypothetical protein [Paucibacter sp. R3-3]MDY0744783.1 hypothetical protein [Paucibacter sp. R3-3]